MNRFDEIQGAARDIAEWVCADPADRNRMADDLIKLVGLMIQAVGKGVAVDGESELNHVMNKSFELDSMSIEYSDDERARLEAEFEQDKALDAAKAHGQYMVGERLQDGARTVVEESMGADLERYERSGLKPVWVAQGNAGRLTAAANQAAEASQGCPFLPGDAIPACDFDPNCPTHGVPGKTTATPVVSHTWVTAMDDHGFLMDWQHCGVCGVRKCDGGCGDPSVGATPDIDCTTHGNDQARQCVERCVGCGDPVDNGRAHGPNQGFGGCC